MAIPIQRKVADVLIIAGSPDGMATAAAYMNHFKKLDVQLIFTQANQVDKIKVEDWAAKRKVTFIDLGVNNEGPQANQKLTVDFVKKINDLGHEIIEIIDEHDRNAWADVLGQCSRKLEDLLIQPQTRDKTKYTSSSAILKEALGDAIGDHAKQLLHDGDLADQMKYEGFAKYFNEATKSKITDNGRREYLVKHFAKSDLPDETIKGWIAEYEKMEANHKLILEKPEDRGNGIFAYNCNVGLHDATKIFSQAYGADREVVALKETKIFPNGKEQLGASIGTNRKDLNVLQTVKDAGINAYGFAAKANIATDDLENAIEAVRNKLVTLNK